MSRITDTQIAAPDDFSARRKANLTRWSHGSVELEERLARTLGILNYRAG